MNSFDEVFEHVKRYCLEKGQIPEVAVKLWIDALHPFLPFSPIFSVLSFSATMNRC